MFKESKLKRREIARQLYAMQTARTEKAGETREYVHVLHEKPYAQVYAEKLKERRENG